MSIAENLDRARERIAGACRRAGRPESEVTLVAVSKTFGADAVAEAVAAGQRHFGENYIQESKDKIPAVEADGLTWHFIGHLQSNKAKFVPGLYDVVQTVGSVKLAAALSKRFEAAGTTLDVLLQINVGGEEQKSGADAAEAEALLRGAAALPALRVRGLMTMPPFLSPEEVRPYFAELRAVRDRLAALNVPGADLAELSMGMSGDYEVAIEEGATIVRVGTAIFGDRRPRE